MNVAKQRFLAIDALRGVAALAVVLFHVQGALDRGPQPWMPHWLAELARGGHFGVNVFFVLSGFVIAYSVRDGLLTPGFLGRFALRRSIRLDPPYWTAVALEVVLIFAGLALIPSLGTPTPTWPQVLAHLAYLQDILGYPHLVYSFWTLCYEFQFYLAFVGLLVAGRSLERRYGLMVARLAGVAVFAMLFAWSVLVHQGVLPNVHRGIALDRWNEFFIGVLAWWVVSGRVRLPLLLAAWVATAILARRPDTAIGTAIVVLVSLLCMRSATSPAFNQPFAWGPIRGLGLVSYSLYLYHASIGWRVVSLAQHRTGSMGLTAAVGWASWAVAIAAALLVAVVGWWCIERPSLAWSRRIALPQRQGPTLDQVTRAAAAVAP
jgi:hypothetical protein